ncbi:hypothetical protein Asppvi_003491 [Aspergillus pseudoviridinutans]|uniref:Zn(2)-C6 fungal-type domain-containing protein n=1 Tax=Aspergillus pseudoviridinutans TaxID=1517512 RepID=A0A9P3B4K9_9EURO|nr:uncharacterized protein Asppvi_003491 [Aspergillus pseudoviridinutans]GIJ84642.1 hypothetical protein Asppvi_003491 [Aspergillus pseudoviridinutans]
MNNAVEGTDKVQARRRMTKAYHRKSRNGCQRCRTRRVKCDEIHPTCGNCERHEVACIYPNAAKKRNDQDTKTDGKQGSDIFGPANTLIPTLSGESELQGTPSSDFNDVGDFQLPESKSRRLLELRLFDYYKDHLMDPLPGQAKSREVTAWSSLIPQLGLEYENVHYMMFSMAACHMLRSDPDNRELLNIQQVYLALAMREQQKAVAELSLENCDSVCYTAMILLIAAVARLWRRPIKPYVPPVESLRLGNGVGAVLRTAVEMLKGNKDAKMWLFINAPPALDPKVIFAKENQIPFQSLLDPDIQPWNPDTHEAYENSVAYLGYLHKSVQDNDPVWIFGRKLISFSIFAPREFLDFVEDQRPRALVILAHYFAFMCRAKELWWALDIPENEIKGIQGVLPPEWQEHLRWPLIMTGQTVI